MFGINQGEKLHPLVTAIEKATGRRPHKSTAVRWTTNGVRGTKLARVKFGARPMTSVEAVRRFLEARTAADDGLPVPTRTAKRKQAAIDRAEAELAAEGL